MATALATLCAFEVARADTLVLPDRLVFGRLVAIGPNAVRFAPDCGRPQDFPRGDVQRIERNGACRPRRIRPYSAGGEICAETPLILYEVKLKTPDQTLLVSDVALANGRLHLRSADGLTAMHGPERRFVSATRGSFCRDSIPPLPALRGFCIETVPWAVNFGPEPVFGNRILTRGLSFYLEDDRGLPIPVDDARSATIRDAFGTAVTVWMGALQDLGPRLPPEARQSLASMISTSDGRYTLLTPPQVVRVGCRGSASFVVRYLSRDARPVTMNGRIKAARAQVAGRTIYLNGITYPCWRASLQAELIIPPARAGDPECMNLVPVLTHELGHALGLAGHRDAGSGSIMDSTIYPDVIWPATSDALELAAVLLQPIQGAAAGRLDADAMGIEISLSPRANQ